MMPCITSSHRVLSRLRRVPRNHTAALPEVPRNHTGCFTPPPYLVLQRMQLARRVIGCEVWVVSQIELTEV